jgi:hypothetical protein
VGDYSRLVEDLAVERRAQHALRGLIAALKWRLLKWPNQT